MRTYTYEGPCTNRIIDGVPTRINRGDQISCEQEINNPFFRTVQENIKEQKFLNKKKEKRK